MTQSYTNHLWHSNKGNLRDIASSSLNLRLISYVEFDLATGNSYPYQTTTTFNFELGTYPGQIYNEKQTSHML